MRDLVILFVHLIVTLAQLAGPGGIRSVVAESVLVKQQLLILNRLRQRLPNLRTSDGTVKLSRICPFCGRILLDQRLRINDLAVAAGGENAAKLLNLTVPLRELDIAIT